MIGARSALFRGRRFADEVIVFRVRWYLRYSLSYRDVAELIAERHLSLDSSTIWRWEQRYAPELNARIRSELKLTNGSWRTDETSVRVAGRWTYLYRAVDSTGATIAASLIQCIRECALGGTMAWSAPARDVHSNRTGVPFSIANLDSAPARKANYRRCVCA